MYFKLLKRVLFETDKRLLWKLAYNMGFIDRATLMRLAERFGATHYGAYLRGIEARWGHR